MDFTFNDDQLALQEVARQASERLFPPEVLRRVVDDRDGVTAEMWRSLCELGWPAMLVPEEHGGAGAGLLETCIVLEQMGRVPVPGPFFSSAVAATLAARALGAGHLLGDLAAGVRRGTVAVQEQGPGDPLSTVRSRARRKGGSWVLNGAKPLVLDGGSTDWVIVVARADDELRSFLLHDLALENVPTMDPTRKAAHLILEETPAESIGPDGSHAPLWRRVLDDIAVALASECVGVCQRALDEAVSYGTERRVFDRPIASFQTVKHRIVDMYQSLEMARVGAQFAAWTSDTEGSERERAAVMAAGYACDAAVHLSGDNIQLHGGVGFTWANDAHFLFKRAKMNQVLLGGSSQERGRLERMLIDAV